MGKSSSCSANIPPRKHPAAPQARTTIKEKQWRQGLVLVVRAVEPTIAVYNHEEIGDICNREQQQQCPRRDGPFADGSPLGRLNEYQVIGRHLPTETNSTPKLYRMRIFAPNTVVAKSRFWYFLMKLKKVKKSNGEVVSINQIHEKRPTKVKNFGIWIRYDSRSGTHNMYKEYREMSRTEAVDALYQDMAARHRARFRSIHILRVVEVQKTDDVKRPYMKQLLTKNLKFPLPHRVAKKASKNIFAAHRPSTFA